MPSSRNNHIPTIVHVVQQLNPSSILDVGTGFGKWGFLFREYTDIRESEHVPARYHRPNWQVVIDGVEGFADYITPVHKYVYDQIYIGDMREVVKGLGMYDIIFLGDVIEHLEQESAAEFLRECIAHASKAVVVSTPSVFVPQGEACGNPLEVHRSHWEAKDFLAIHPDAVITELENEIRLAMFLKSDVDVPVIAPSMRHSPSKRQGWRTVPKRALRKVVRTIKSKVAATGSREFKSSEYWDARYESGGNSGAGSYGMLAKYKASFITSLMEKESIGSAIEFGCGDGAQLSLIPYKHYVGLDVSPHAIARCEAKFKGDSSKEFFMYPLQSEDGGKLPRAELGLSLDVLYHLIEDDVFDQYLVDLFSAAEKLVVIYSSNCSSNQLCDHVKHREFVSIVQQRFPEWGLTFHEKNPHPATQDNDPAGSFADFFVFRRK